MKADFLPEPDLDFGVDRHVDIRFGIMNYGPVDYASPLAPKEIKVGIVGTSATIEGVSSWLERCRKEIPPKVSNQPNLFPKFPGYRPDIGFRSTLVLERRLQREISLRVFMDMKKHKNVNRVVRESVELFYNELNYLAENTSSSVLICAIPQELLTTTASIEGQAEQAGVLPEDDNATENPAGDKDEENAPLNFHHLLKAKAMSVKIPIQLIIPSTYDEKKRLPRKSYSKELKRLQDEATRAWNLHTALYYKAKGIPWRLPRSPEEYSTCYIGISFYHTLDKSALLTSVAQIFNERGEGVVVRGGQATISKQDRRPHLDEKGAYELLTSALKRYREEHKNFPARIVIHKSSGHTDTEIEGFLSAAKELKIEMVDLLSLTHSTTRLFRIGFYPPLRGSYVSMDDKSHLLYSRGSVDFFCTYPGLYVPLPLLIRCDNTEQSHRFLAQEILSLTKMNWNNTQFDGGDPITMRAANQVSSILKYIEEGDPVESSYRFYM